MTFRFMVNNQVVSFGCKQIEVDKYERWTLRCCFCFIFWLQNISLQIIILRSRCFLTAGTEREEFVQEEQNKSYNKLSF